MSTADVAALLCLLCLFIDLAGRFRAIQVVLLPFALLVTGLWRSVHDEAPLERWRCNLAVGVTLTVRPRDLRSRQPRHLNDWNRFAEWAPPAGAFDFFLS